MCDRVVEGNDSVGKAFRDSLRCGVQIWIVQLGFPKKIPDDDGQMMSNVLDGDITKVTFEKYQKKILNIGKKSKSLMAFY